MNVYSEWFLGAYSMNAWVLNTTMDSMHNQSVCQIRQMSKNSYTSSSVTVKMFMRFKS